MSYKSDGCNTLCICIVLQISYKKNKNAHHSKTNTFRFAQNQYYILRYYVPIECSCHSSSVSLATETLELIKVAFGDVSQRRCILFDCIKCIKEGRQSIDDDHRPGRRPTSKTYRFFR